MKKLLALMAVGVAHFVALAQMPTDVDLRSAYCIGALEQQVRNLEKDAADIPEMRETLDQMRREAQTDLDRLRSYLLPRTKALDAEGISAARSRGIIDNANAEGHRRACSRHCREANPRVDKQWVDKLLQCTRKCGATEPAVRRVKQCDAVDWLPF